MKFDQTQIENRIDEVLADSANMLPNDHQSSYDSILVEKTIFVAISILKIFYGENSSQTSSLLELRNRYIKNGPAWKYSNAYEIQSLVNGLLNTLKSDIEFNL